MVKIEEAVEAQIFILIVNQAQKTLAPTIPIMQQ